VLASVHSFVSEGSNIFKTRIEGANIADTGLTGLTVYLAASYLDLYISLSTSEPGCPTSWVLILLLLIYSFYPLFTLQIRMT
jgi:hypothetical protein